MTESNRQVNGFTEDEGFESPVNRRTEDDIKSPVNGFTKDEIESMVNGFTVDEIERRNRIAGE